MHRKLAFTLVLLASLFGSVLDRVAGTPQEEKAAPSPTTPNPQDLLGNWIVYLRPSPKSAPQEKAMRFTSLEKGLLKGSFYDTAFEAGRVNADWGAVRFAFTTRDGSSSYCTQGVLRGDRIEGTTLSEERGFLAVWTAHRATPAGLAALADRAAVERAALDYVEGLYRRKPELLDRGVHPALKKSGFRRAAPGEPYMPRRTMSFEELRDIAANRKAPEVDGAPATYTIEVLEVLDATACVRVDAFWGIDLMNLVKQNGRWQILQVVWQTHPRRS